MGLASEEIFEGMKCVRDGICHLLLCEFLKVDCGEKRGFNVFSLV